MQEILAYTTVILAILFLVNKFFIPKKKKDKNCGGGNCGCN